MGNRMIALIPAYEPDGRILGLTAELRDRGFDIVVVDDGSGPDYREIFEDLSEGAMASNRKKTPKTKFSQKLTQMLFALFVEKKTPRGSYV